MLPDTLFISFLDRQFLERINLNLHGAYHYLRNWYEIKVAV